MSTRDKQDHVRVLLYSYSYPAYRVEGPPKPSPDSTKMIPTLLDRFCAGTQLRIREGFRLHLEKDPSIGSVPLVGSQEGSDFSILSQVVNISSCTAMSTNLKTLYLDAVWLKYQGP